MQAYPRKVLTSPMKNLSVGLYINLAGMRYSINIRENMVALDFHYILAKSHVSYTLHQFHIYVDDRKFW